MEKRPDPFVWVAGFLLVAALIVVMRFESRDPDSSLHASIAARLAQEPVRRWVAPEWWGFWPDAHLTGLYVEHPSGIFLLPALLERAGLPGIQSAYIAGVSASLLALLFAGRLIQRVSSAADARAAITLVQLTPLAFIFRVRANHEYPMLVCLLLALIAVEYARDSIKWSLPLALALTAALFIKGVFAGLVLGGVGVWLGLDAARRQSIYRQIGALAIAIAITAAAAWAYDQWYMAATGHPFWSAYWQRQIAPLTTAEQAAAPLGYLRHVVFYLPFLLWHPAPWSVSLVTSGWSMRSRLVVFVLAFAAIAVALLSVSSRVAERYLFSVNFLIGLAGAVVAHRSWPWVRRTFDRVDARIPALPAVLWTTLIVLRLTIGQWLPRWQWR